MPISRFLFGEIGKVKKSGRSPRKARGFGNGNQIARPWESAYTESRPDLFRWQEVENNTPVSQSMGLMMVPVCVTHPVNVRSVCQCAIQVGTAWVLVK